MDPDAVLVQRQMQWCFDAINLVRSSAVQHRSYNLQTTAINTLRSGRSFDSTFDSKSELLKYLF